MSLASSEIILLHCIVTAVISVCIKKTLNLVNFCVGILIWEMEGNKEHFWHIMLCYFKKGKNTTETHTKQCVQCVGKVLWLIEHVKSGLGSFLVLLTLWPNNSLLWGCLMHWKMFSSTFGLYPPIAVDSQHSQNIQINKVIGENEKCVFYFTEKT